MSESNTDKSAPAKAEEAKRAPDRPEHVYLVSYPKIVFLYPTVVTALFCAVFMWAKGGLPERVAAPDSATAGVLPHVMLDDTRVVFASFDELATDSSGNDGAAQTQNESEESAAEPPLAANEESGEAAESGAATEEGPTYHFVCARIFLLVFFLNLVVIAFDFPRTTSLTWFFAVVAIAVGLWTLFRMNEGLAPRVVQSLLSVQPAANSSFYFIFALGMLILYIAVLISRRFDYWEVRGNELLHHHGVLSDLERFSAPNLRIDKEINDVFEYLLMRSGRLILHPSNERRAIVLENVLFISRKEDAITRMLGALQVRVRTDSE
ncbi:MAG: hypothetical protein KDA91_02140 [Planctomycetaceae bacterium]|nr:hypothetical protein [Planctomycetaceae bacterium]